MLFGGSKAGGWGPKNFIQMLSFFDAVEIIFSFKNSLGTRTENIYKK